MPIKLLFWKKALLSKRAHLRNFCRKRIFFTAIGRRRGLDKEIIRMAILVFRIDVMYLHTFLFLKNNA